MEFKSFSDIERFTSKITITEKIHGTNAQILIEEMPGGLFIIEAASRTRLITPEDDNFGFAKFVEENKEELIRLLGPGRHFGEWFGSGINSGYGYKKGERFFALFHQGFRNKPLPENVSVVPVLYEGPYREGIVEETMTKLKAEGSKAVPGFMSPEGVVIRFERNGAMFKQVFEAEETGWEGKKKEKGPREPGPNQEEVNKLLQPIRLEKLLSKDEAYTREYPKSLTDIVKAYAADMEKEGQFENVDERVVKSAKNKFFPWIKLMMAEKGYSS